MTAFTRPFAYFSSFQITLDPILVNKYAVISNLQYSADGSVYEDGVIPQFYGFASGNWGEIAVVAMAVGILLGAPFGLGSVLVTALQASIFQFACHVTKVEPRNIPHEDFAATIRRLRKG